MKKEGLYDSFLSDCLEIIMFWSSHYVHWDSYSLYLAGVDLAVITQ